MANPNSFTLKQYPHHVEPVGLPGPAVAVDPDRRRPGHLALLSPTHSLNGIAELVPGSGLHFHEHDRPLPLGNQVDVPVAAPEPPLKDPPPMAYEPSLGDALPGFSQCLRGR